MSMTTVAAGTMSALYNVTPAIGGMPVLAGDGVYISGWARAAATARSFPFGAFFYHGNGNFVTSVFGPSNRDAPPGWSFPSRPLPPPPPRFPLPLAPVLAP